MVFNELVSLVCTLTQNDKKLISVKPLKELINLPYKLVFGLLQMYKSFLLILDM